MNIVFVEAEEFKQTVAEFRKRVGRYIPFRNVPSCEKIHFGRRFRRRVTSITCRSTTWAEAYLVGILSTPPPPGHEGDLVIVCLIKISRA